MVMKKIIKNVCNLLDEVNPKDTIILHHADHDGFTSSALLNIYFYRKFGQKAKIIYPSENNPYFKLFQEILNVKPKYLFIVDALVAKHKTALEKILQNTLVVNMDHHDIVEIQNKNYIELNPHKFGIEYMNSSGLCWLMLRKIDKDYFDRLCWLAGIGAVQDYCIEDNELLFQTLEKFGFINTMNFEKLIDSELMRIAKMINATIRAGQVEYAYQKIFDAGLENRIDILKTDRVLVENYKIQEKNLEKICNKFKKMKKVFDKLVFFNLEGNPIQYISYIAEIDRDKKIYVGYSKGLLGFRSLFYNYDVRRLGKLFNGGGPHPRVAGGKTTKSFDETIKIIIEYINSEKSQKSLNDFYEN